MKKMQKRYKTEFDISTLWEEFRNDKLFDFDEISSIKKVNADTFEFSFKCRKNKYSGFFYPEFKGIVQSSEGKVSYVTMSQIMSGTKPTIFLYLLVLVVINLFLRLMGHGIYYSALLGLLLIGVICFEKNPYKKILQKHLCDLEDRYKLAVVPNKYT